MKKQPLNTPQERKMKFAEAGVLFVLVLAITVFVGARLTRHDISDEATVSVAQTLDETPVAADPGPEVVADAASADTVGLAVATEPSATLAQEPPRLVTYAMAEQTYFDGDYEAAAAAFASYVATHGENAWGYYMLGLSNWKAGDLEAAADAFESALALKPDHIKSLINYSRVLLEQDQPAAARTEIELALQQEPNNVDANRMYSRICHSEGDLDAAAAGYLELLQNAADDVWSLNNLGLIRIEQGQFDAALAPLAKAAELAPALACVQNNLGIALERTGHFTAAAAAYEMALAADGSYAKADASLARVAELTEAADLTPVDLASLAASFSAGPVTGNEDLAASELSEGAGDMDVAATGPDAGAGQDPQ